MSKKVLIVSTSLRAGSNSDILARECAKGAKDAGHEVEYISLKGKKIEYCIGCLTCQMKGSCVLKDDMAEIMAKVKDAQVIVYATPIYYYEMSGQMKTLLDRMNSLYPKNYKFRDVYMLSVAAEDEILTPKRAESGLQGWIDCFANAQLKGTVFCGGVNAPSDIDGNGKLNEAYEMGIRV